MLAATGLLHLQLTLLGWLRPAQIALPAFFAPTPAGMLVLLVTSFIFVFIAAYGIFYMREQEMQSEPVYLGCMLLFLGTMSMAALADHPIVLWIAIEATTLASAPLIFINRSKKALEATWKYVLICSVGIALALLGFFFITLSLDRAGLDLPLTFTSLNSVADRLDPRWHRGRQERRPDRQARGPGTGRQEPEHRPGRRGARQECRRRRGEHHDQFRPVL